MKKRRYLNWGFRAEFAKMHRGICKQRYKSMEACAVTEPEVVDQIV